MATADRINEVFHGKLLSAEAHTAARERIAWICRRVRGSTILDVGCSQGIVSILLARMGKYVTGIDVDENSIDYARKELAAESDSTRERVQFLLGDALRYEFEQNGFDTVIMGQLLEHVPEPEAFLDLARRVCRTDGTVIITTPFGLLVHPDHKHTFYLYRFVDLVSPFFTLNELDIVGGRICFCGEPRDASSTGVLDASQVLDERWHRRIQELSESEFERKEKEKYEELLAHKGRIEKLQGKTERLENKKQELQGETERLENEKQELQGAIEDRENDKQRLQVRIEGLEKERDELQEKNRALRNSVTFRVGRAMVTAVRPSRTTIALPLRLWRIYRDYRSSKRHTQTGKTQEVLGDQQKPQRARAARGESVELFTDRELRDRLIHLGLRKAMAEPTYDERSNYLLQRLVGAHRTPGQKRKGVSIITCTNKPDYMQNIFGNYDRQQYEDKELIVVLNNNSLDMDEWMEEAEKHDNATVYRMDEEHGLGTCLNSGVDKARFEHIAKFDDDDYYAPAYLEDMINAFVYSGAAVVGKSTYHVYFEENRALALRFPGNEHRFAKHVAGPTIIACRCVFDKVSFMTDKAPGEDTRFLIDCRENGFLIFSVDRFNFAQIRRSSKDTHTWKIADDEMMQTSRIIAFTDDYIPHIVC